MAKSWGARRKLVAGSIENTIGTLRALVTHEIAAYELVIPVLQSKLSLLLIEVPSGFQYTRKSTKINCVATISNSQVFHNASDKIKSWSEL